jgi:hypothetical protein
MVSLPSADRPRPRASLAQVLAYRNKNVVERFRKELPVSEVEAQDIWRETKKWLWFCGANRHEHPPSLTWSMAIMDEMWHAFVLFTPDYMAFCERFFGRYLHHVPNTHADALRERAAMKANPERTTKAFEARRRAQYERVVHLLGEETLEKWYVDYAKRYSPRALVRLRRRGLASLGG